MRITRAYGLASLALSDSWGSVRDPTSKQGGEGVIDEDT